MSTNFAYGLKSRGVPLDGNAARYTGWWGVTSWFVDYDHGSNGNTGKDTTAAFKDLQTAIDSASAGDVIYVRNRDQEVTGTDPEFIIPASTTNWSIPETKTHLSIIGASNLSHTPTEAGRLAVYLSGSTSTSTVMQWNAAFGLLENLSFRSGSSTGYLLYLYSSSTSLGSQGTVVNNCEFKKHAGTAAIYIQDTWYINICGCEFHDNMIGISAYGSSSTIQRLHISDCLFRNDTASLNGQNIRVAGSNNQDILIHNCVFTGAIPTGGTNLFINIANAATGTISECYFPIDTTEGTVGITDNGLSQIHNHQTFIKADYESYSAPIA